MVGDKLEHRHVGDIHCWIDLYMGGVINSHFVHEFCKSALRMHASDHPCADGSRDGKSPWIVVGKKLLTLDDGSQGHPNLMVGIICFNYSFCKTLV